MVTRGRRRGKGRERGRGREGGEGGGRGRGGEGRWRGGKRSGVTVLECTVLHHADREQG